MYLKIKWSLFFKIRLFIGRLERCPQCNKIMWNRGINLMDDLYHKQKNNTYCYKCYPKQEMIK